MNANIYNAVAALLDADSTLTTYDKEKILAVCRLPRNFVKPEERRIPQLLTLKEVSKMLGVSRYTVLRMTKDGEVRAIRFRADGWPHYDLDEILALVNKGKAKEG